MFIMKLIFMVVLLLVFLNEDDDFILNLVNVNKVECRFCVFRFSLFVVFRIKF